MHRRSLSSFALARSCAVVSVVVAWTPAAAQVFRCTVGDQTVYQQNPCDKSSTSTKQLAAPVEPRESSDGPSKAEIDRLRKNYEKAKAEADEAIAKNCAGRTVDKLAVGMSEADIFCIPRYRQTHKVNVTTTATGDSKQYVYPERSGATYLYFTNGKLTAIQSGY